MPKFYKKGPLTKEEKQIILENIHQEDSWLAEKLFREPKTIAKYKKEKITKDIQKEKEAHLVSESESYLQKLHNWPNWKTIRSSYTAEEIEVLEHHWIQLHSQFKGDTTHAEDMMILKLADLEIIMERNKQQRASSLLEITRMEKEAVEETMRMSSGGTKDRATLTFIENNITGLRAMGTALSKEYADWFNQHMKLMQELKATRNQRLDKIVDGKQTFAGWLKMLTDIEYRTKQSREMELFRKAMDRETARLSEYHKYEDGEVDQPLLTPDTIIKEETVENPDTGN